MGKVIVFVFVSLAILVVLTLLKESGAGAVTWLGVVAIPLIYKSMFYIISPENRIRYFQFKTVLSKFCRNFIFGY